MSRHCILHECAGDSTNHITCKSGTACPGTSAHRVSVVPPQVVITHAVNHILWWFNSAVTVTLWALASGSRLTGDMLSTVMCDFMQNAMPNLAILTTRRVHLGS